ncbi:MAG: response regulator [Candidatus Omnitrophica bacterium]|nr:response regulator [Candidatus Omnitrophota bacterium]
MIRNILLAEDERGIALLVKTQLERHGYVVHTAQDGLEALEVLRKELIDLLVTDVVMPRMDGVDLYLEIKKEKRTASLPIIIVTDKEVFKESFSALGVDHFLPKTSDIDSLLGKIRTIERQAVNNKDYHKVLVCGENDEILGQMQALLRERGCLVTTAKTTLDIVSKALQMTPHLIVIDVALKGHVSAKELIRSLKCYDFLHRSQIVAFSHFLPDQLGGSVGLIEGLEDEIKGCLEAGARKYIGRFNRVTFLDQLQEFGIK